MFLQELKNFSKTNWWTYIALILVLGYVALTGKGSLTEVALLTLGNFIGNLFIMVMQSNYTAGNNKIGGLYHISATFIFTLMSLYSLVYDGFYQYIVWQISYILAAFKAYSTYNFHKNFSFINEYLVAIINALLLSAFVYIGVTGAFGLAVNLGFSSIAMALGFSFVTTGLVSTNDRFRYWTNIIGVIFIVLGSSYGLYLEFIANNINGMTVGYVIFPASVLIFYCKLLPKYLKT